jgi:hypothetical protein
MPTEDCLLKTAYCLLPTEDCLLKTANGVHHARRVRVRAKVRARLLRGY